MGILGLTLCARAEILISAQHLKTVVNVKQFQLFPTIPTLLFQLVQPRVTMCCVALKRACACTLEGEGCK